MPNASITTTRTGTNVQSFNFVCDFLFYCQHRTKDTQQNTQIKIRARDTLWGDASSGHYVHVIGIDNTLTDWKYPTNWSIRCSRLRLRGRLNQSIFMATRGENFLNIFQELHRTHTDTHTHTEATRQCQVRKNKLLVMAKLQSFAPERERETEREQALRST